jgi:hypothetical protein
VTLQVTVKNTTGGDHVAKVETFGIVDGEPRIIPEQCKLLGKDEEITVTVYDGRFFTISEDGRDVSACKAPTIDHPKAAAKPAAKA